jgi:hypothetical protein
MQVDRVRAVAAVAHHWLANLLQINKNLVIDPHHFMDCFIIQEGSLCSIRRKETD